MPQRSGGVRRLPGSVENVLSLAVFGLACAGAGAL